MDKIQDNLLPSLREKWLRYTGAREVVQHAATHADHLGKEYQDLLTLALQIGGFDSARPWKVNLQDGTVMEADEREMAVNGAATG